MPWVGTHCLEHFIALVQDKVLDVRDSQNLVPDKAIQSSRRSNHNMWTSLFIPNQLDVLLHGRAAIEHRSTRLRHILSEALVLILNLEGEFPRMTQDKDRNFAINRLNLLQRGKDKHGRFPESRFRLTQNIGGKNRLRETHLLDLAGMLETFPGD
jgi:hypothetical protein